MPRTHLDDLTRPTLDGRGWQPTCERHRHRHPQRPVTGCVHPLSLSPAAQCTGPSTHTRVAFRGNQPRPNAAFATASSSASCASSSTAVPPQHAAPRQGSLLRTSAPKDLHEENDVEKSGGLGGHGGYGYLRDSRRPPADGPVMSNFGNCDAAWTISQLGRHGTCKSRIGAPKPPKPQSPQSPQAPKARPPKVPKFGRRGTSKSRM